MAKKVSRIDLTDSFEKIPVKIYPDLKQGSLHPRRLAQRSRAGNIPQRGPYRYLGRFILQVVSVIVSLTGTCATSFQPQPVFSSSNSALVSTGWRVEM